MMPDERGSEPSPRGSLPARFDVVVDDRSEHNFWSDLSMTVQGLFVATHQPLRIGDVVDVSVRLSDDPEPIPVTGVVRWTRPYVDGSEPAGLGLKFLEASDDTRDALARFVETVRDPLFFELDDAPVRRRRRSSPSRHV
jgi:uncharacterized protein (TIGR02266 family)